MSAGLLRRRAAAKTVGQCGSVILLLPSAPAALPTGAPNVKKLKNRKTMQHHLLRMLLMCMHVLLSVCLCCCCCARAAHLLRAFFYSWQHNMRFAFCLFTRLLYIFIFILLTQILIAPFYRPLGVAVRLGKQHVALLQLLLMFMLHIIFQRFFLLLVFALYIFYFCCDFFIIFFFHCLPRKCADPVAINIMCSCCC